MADSDSADSPKDDPRDKFKPLHERLRVTAACAEELKPILYALSKIKAGAPSRSSVIEKGKLAQAVWYSHKMNDLKLHSEIYDAAETPERARTVFSQAVRNCSKGNPPWLKEYTKKIIASAAADAAEDDAEFTASAQHADGGGAKRRRTGRELYGIDIKELLNVLVAEQLAEDGVDPEMWEALNTVERAGYEIRAFNEQTAEVPSHVVIEELMQKVVPVLLKVSSLSTTMVVLDVVTCDPETGRLLQKSAHAICGNTVSDWPESTARKAHLDALVSYCRSILPPLAAKATRAKPKAHATSKTATSGKETIPPIGGAPGNGHDDARVGGDENRPDGEELQDEAIPFEPEADVTELTVLSPASSVLSDLTEQSRPPSPLSAPSTTAKKRKGAPTAPNETGRPKRAKTVVAVGDKGPEKDSGHKTAAKGRKGGNGGKDGKGNKQVAKQSVPERPKRGVPIRNYHLK